MEAEFPTGFAMPAIKQVYDTPLEQVAYAYSLIERKEEKGGGIRHSLSRKIRSGNWQAYS